MRKIMMLVLLLTLFLTVGMIYADESGGFWDNLLRKVNSIASRPSSHRTYTSVMGIRGAEDIGSDSLYWKGAAEESTKEDLFISEAEADRFANAVSLASAGDYQTALAEFNRFITDYPGSPILVDAYEAAEKLAILAAEPVPAAGTGD